MAGELILLTGATGFLGYVTLLKALQAGYRVRCAVRSPSGIDKVLAAESIKALSPTKDQLSWEIVPDITIPGAYDKAVQDVDYIIHCASPIPGFSGSDDRQGSNEDIYVKPAVNGVLGMFDSAARVGSSVKRIVVTSSVVAIFPTEYFGGQIPADAKTRTPEDRLPNMDVSVGAPGMAGPYETHMAYIASKIAALNAADAWMKENKTSFDHMYIMPGWINGKDELTTKAGDLFKGSNSNVLRLVTGVKTEGSINANFVSVDSCALAHVVALKPEVAGGQSFILGELEDVDSAVAIGKKYFPEAFKEGIFSEDGHQPLIRIPQDASSTEKVLGLKIESFEDHVKGLLGQYVALKRQE